MRPTITAFASSPDRGRGLARDMRVRWALEEVSQAYDVRLLTFAEMKEPAHRALSPFGQIPTYEDGGLTLFESGAIVLHIAERHAGLLPDDPDARARVIAWMFAAVSTVDPRSWSAAWLSYLSARSPGTTSASPASTRGFERSWTNSPRRLARPSGWKAPSARPTS